MGFFSGRATFLRFKVHGANPKRFGEQHLERLTNHKAGRQKIATADGVDVPPACALGSHHHLVEGGFWVGAVGVAPGAHDPGPACGARGLGGGGEGGGGPGAGPVRRVHADRGDESGDGGRDGQQGRGSATRGVHSSLLPAA